MDCWMWLDATLLPNSMYEANETCMLGVAVVSRAKVVLLCDIMCML
jgi:hypothetical protein